MSDKYKLIPRKYNFNVFLDAHVRFSQTKFFPEINLSDKNEKDRENEQNQEEQINDEFMTKTFICPDKNCKSESSFPFPKQKDYLENNHVRKIVKIAYHEESEHYAVYHVNISNFTPEKKFIYKRNEN